ncbi:unnamed protein product [Chilo suppressalis]|uniref:Uncharacterized protein n=1 Tax=Chilo suppressalis TaxID=168631 RepID=A0ABN8B0J6_CHISP|nr:unnamed protein product [Chilo suppressalis]
MGRRSTWLADELPAQLSELGLRPRKMAQPGYTVQKFFFRDEPMNKAVNLLETAESRCEELEEYSASTVDQGFSEVDYTDKSEDCENPKFRRILKVLGHLDREAKIWEKLPPTCDKVMEPKKLARAPCEWTQPLRSPQQRPSDSGTTPCTRCLMRPSHMHRNRHHRIPSLKSTSRRSEINSTERLEYRSVYEAPYASLTCALQPSLPHLVTKVYINEI